MTWQITLNHVCAVLYDISLLARAYRCMQMFPQTLLFKSAAWHGTFDMIISHLSDLTSPSSDWRCQQRWGMMATLNTNLDELQKNGENQTMSWSRYLNKGIAMRGGFSSPRVLTVFSVFEKLSRNSHHKKRKLLKTWLFISCWPTH